jgi:tryptophan synthase alpha chain
VSRLMPTFQSLKQAKRKALVPFITAGDPSPEFTVPTLHAMVDAGADIIELGVPFSDPMADGPVIQKASERALAHKMNLRRTLAMVAEFRRQDMKTPVVLMGYLNPIEALTYEGFAQEAQQSGVDGVLTVDLPPEEAGELLPLLTEARIDLIFLLAPNSTEERIKKMSYLGSGFLYYVSLKGVTGASHLNLSEVERKLAQIRTLTDLPIGVGFGVSSAEMAAAVAKLADAVVVGSAVVSRIESNPGKPEQARKAITDLLQAMRAAMDA